MAQDFLVEAEIQAGAQFLEKLRDRGVAIEGGAWVYDAERNAWLLLVAKPGAAQAPLEATGEVLDVLRDDMSMWETIDSSRLLILDIDDPLVRELAPHWHARGAPLKRIRSIMTVGRGAIEDAIIYRLAA